MNTLVRCHRVTCRQCGSGTWVPVTWNTTRCLCADCRLCDDLKRKRRQKEANRVG